MRIHFKLILKTKKMIRKGLNKFAKGIFAFLTVKLLLFGILFLTHACQKDDNHNFFIDSDKEIALKNFENSLNNITSKNNGIISIYKEKKSQYKNKQTKGIGTNLTQELNNLETKTELEVKNQITPLLKSSLSLLESYGFNEKDVQEVYSKDSPIWVVVGITLHSLEKNNLTAFNNKVNFISESIYAQGNKSWTECAGQAGGFTAVMNAIRLALKEKSSSYLKSKAAKSVFKKVLRKALLKMSSRLLGGWISVGFFIYDFSKCMKWMKVESIDSPPVFTCNDIVRVTKKPSYINYPNYEKYVYLSKKDIGYISDTNHKLATFNKNKSLKTYKKTLDKGTPCKVIETYFFTSNDVLIISSLTTTSY